MNNIDINDNDCSFPAFNFVIFSANQINKTLAFIQNKTPIHEQKQSISYFGRDSF